MATKLAIALLISPVACPVLLLTILMNVSALNIEKRLSGVKLWWELWCPHRMTPVSTDILNLVLVVHYVKALVLHHQ